MFQVLLAQNGYYVIQHLATGRVIGRTFRWNEEQADILRFELERVHEIAREVHCAN